MQRANLLLEARFETLNLQIELKAYNDGQWWLMQTFDHWCAEVRKEQFTPNDNRV